MLAQAKLRSENRRSGSTGDGGPRKPTMNTGTANAANANATSTRPLVHPHARPCTMASDNDINMITMIEAPTTSGSAAFRSAATRGIEACPKTNETAAITGLNKNDHRQLANFTTEAPTVGPNAPPSDASPE